MSAKVILEGEDAKALWKQGKGAWNAWVEKNPDAYVSFVGINFSSAEISRWTDLKGIRRRGFNFEGIRFPNGGVSLAGVRFANGEVSFRAVDFGLGDVDFTETYFDSQRVCFECASFGPGNVRFYRSYFGSGDVSFSGATFGLGVIRFNDC